MAEFLAVLQIISAVIMFGAAVYLARFRYQLIEDMKKVFLTKPEDRDDFPVTRRENAIMEQHADREHARFDSEFAKVWAELSRMRQP